MRPNRGNDFIFPRSDWKIRRIRHSRSLEPTLFAQSDGVANFLEQSIQQRIALTRMMSIAQQSSNPSTESNPVGQETLR
jgi:hypothetical protein